MIYIFGCDDEEKAAFQSEAKRRSLDISVDSSTLDVARAALLSQGAVISISHKISVGKELIDALVQKDIRYINTRSVGVNHVDVRYANQHGITVEGVNYSPESIAEHTIMLMLMAVRNASAVCNRSAHGDFRLSPFRVKILSQMTVGIIGMGKIGTCVAKLLKSFGCGVISNSTTPMDGFSYADLPTLLSESDIVTLHMPLNSDTYHFMSETNISMMKPGAILVNTSRGGVVDTAALEKALQNGHISAAALDVVEGEEGFFYQDYSRRTEEIPFFKLMSLPNVILTPHCAFYTKQALADIVNNTLTNCMTHERSNNE